jgi:hypothetical protein
VVKAGRAVCGQSALLPANPRCVACSRSGRPIYNQREGESELSECFASFTGMRGRNRRTRRAGREGLFLSFTQNVMLVPGERREQIADDTAGSGLHFHRDCHARAKIYDPIVGLQLPLVE